MVTSPRQLLGTFGAQRLWQLNLQSNHNDFIFGGLNNKCRRPGLDPWGRNIPWRREQLPTPVFLPGEFHGQRSLVGYSPWGCRESDTTEQLTLSLSKQQKFILTRVWRQKSKIFLQKLQGRVLMTGFWRWLAFLGLWAHHSNVCVCGHVTLSSSVSNIPVSVWQRCCDCIELSRIIQAKLPISKALS